MAAVHVGRVDEVAARRDVGIEDGEGAPFVQRPAKDVTPKTQRVDLDVGVCKAGDAASLATALRAEELSLRSAGQGTVFMGGLHLDLKERRMARIIVMTDPLAGGEAVDRQDGTSVLLDERVKPIHLHDGYAAGQLIERLAWAVTDAEQAEQAREVV
jgi:hypothetical protein